MNPLAILLPVLALAAWTGFVMMLVPIARFRSVFRREVTANDFRYGESSAVPPRVSIPNRNYMNLLEAPMLFYVACMLAFGTSGVTPTSLALAWAYVALRVVHSVIHLTYNRVTHRLGAFAASSLVLLALWITVGAHIVSRGVR